MRRLKSNNPCAWSSGGKGRRPGALAIREADEGEKLAEPPKTFKEVRSKVKYSVFLVSGALILSSLCFLGCGEDKGDAGPGDPNIDPNPNEIAVVVKVTGIPWFNRLGQGVSDAAEDFGINAVMVGPSEGDNLAEEQVQIVEGLIEDKVGAIGIVPQDTDLLDPVIRRARDAGIVVITHESPSPRQANWDIETINNTAYAERVFTHLAELMGGEGQFALIVGGFDVGLHNLWADQGLQFVQANYPKMTLVSARAEDREPCGEDADACYKATNRLLVEFPDLKGIAAFGSQGPIGAGRALRDLDRDDVNVVGAAIPSQVGQLLDDGHVKAAYLWDPRDAGYAMIAVAHLLLGGGDIEKETNYPRLGEATVDAEEKNIVFDRILEITAENAGDLGF
jgi:simple sugar transport system substrate-binding protein